MYAKLECNTERVFYKPKNVEANGKILRNEQYWYETKSIWIAKESVENVDKQESKEEKCFEYPY